MNFNLKDLIFNNWHYKLLSLGFAIFFWYMVIGQQNSEITIELPIEFRNVPANYVIVNNPINKVSILLSGPSPIIKSLTKENLSFPVDLGKIHIGKNEIYLFPHMLNLPRKVNVKLINPSKFIIDVDKFETRVLPVVPKLVGKVKAGYKLSSVDVTPPVVKITSLERELNKIDHIDTDPVNLFEKDKSFEEEVPLNANIKYLKSLKPEKVKIKVAIIEDLVEVKIRNVKIKVKSGIDLSQYKLKLLPDKVNITVKINSTIKNLISKKDFEAFVNINAIDEPEYNVEVMVPENVKLVDFNPKKISIKFTKHKKEKRYEKTIRDRRNKRKSK